MRKIIVITMVTLDGVMQAPGGPGEDNDGGFAYGGWTVPYMDEAGGEAMAKEMGPTDYLLGRRTFDIFASYWPQHAENWQAINDGTKYVLSTTAESSDWANTVFIKSLEDIKTLKSSEGSGLQVWGSSQLVQLLLQNDLVDELRLKIFPITLGQGKKLFGDGTIPAAFTLVDHSATPSGVISASYQRAGEVQTGNAADLDSAT